MIKVTHKQHHEHINCREDEIILSGTPSSLHGPVTLHNSSDEHVFIQELPMKNAKNAAGIFPVNTSLKPGEVRIQNVHYPMDPVTPPGTYNMNVQMGNTNKNVKMIVHESLSIQLSPQKIILVGAEPGKVHTKEVLLSNKGNIAVTVPTIKHNTVTDMDLICRNLSKAIRAKGDEGFDKTMDEFTRNVKKDIGDWVDVSIKEADQVVQPGKSLLLHIDITIPKDVNQNYHYTGDIRIIDKELHYEVINKKK